MSLPFKNLFRLKASSGTLLVEVLLATLLLSLFVMATIASIANAYEQPIQDGEMVQALFYLDEGMEAVRSLRDSGWNELAFTETGFDFSETEWTFLGEGTFDLMGDYVRTIEFEEVCRDSENLIVVCPQGEVDLFSQKVTVTVSWEDASGETHSVSKSSYLNNWASQNWIQTDWIGGNGQAIWEDETAFDTDNEQIDFGDEGEIKLALACSADNTFLVEGADFQAGEFINTQYQNGEVTLDAIGLSEGTGTYTSPIYDLLQPTSWTSFSWIPGWPYQKALPNLKGIESSYYYGNIDMTGNLLLYHLDESASSIAVADDSGSNHPAVPSGVSLGATGHFGSAASFDGNSDAITESSAENYLNGLSAFSISLWVKSDEMGSDQGIFIAKDPDGEDAVLTLRYAEEGEMGSEENILTAAITVDSTTLLLESEANVQTTEWQHLVLTWSSGGTLHLYINGVETVPSFSSAAATGSISGVTTFILGKGAEDIGSSTWDGLIDEVAIWNRELTPLEVSGLYERGLPYDLKFQLRVCADETCSTESFVGPDGTPATYYSELDNEALTPPSFDISEFDDSLQYFQYQVTFETSGSLAGPSLHQTTLLYDCNPYITAFVEDDTEVEFEAGDLDTGLLEYDTDHLELSSAGLTAGEGTYLSLIFDAENSTLWNDLTWIPGAAYGKELPDNQAIETGYLQANVDMSSNQLLLHLNESSGVLIDDSGNGLDATPVGFPTYAVTGKYNTALQFDGVDDVLTVSDSNLLDFTDSFSIEGWFDPLGNTNLTPDIGGVLISNYEYDPTQGAYPDLQHIAGDVYAIAYQGPSLDGYIATLDIDPDGTVHTPLLQLYEFDMFDALYPDLIHVRDNLYAIAYTGIDSDGFLATFRINSNGTISPVIDRFEFDTSNGMAPEILPVTGDIFLISYEGLNKDGFLKTVSINSAGDISSTIDTYEFDPSNGEEINMFQIDSNIYALAYRTHSNRGALVTISVDSTGDISTIIDSLNFEGTFVSWPSVALVGGDTYAVSYIGPASTGRMITVQIQDNGQIGSAVLDYVIFSPTAYNVQQLLPLSADSFLLAYQGLGHDGYLATLSITPSGDIDSTLYDTFMFYSNPSSTPINPSVALIDADTGIVAYTDSSTDGFVASFSLNSAAAGIFKSGSFLLHVDNDEILGVVNQMGVSTAPVEGWNHVVLTYDQSLTSNQIKLYLNGSQAATAHLNEPMLVNASILKIGEFYNGILDELALYEEALSPEDVLAHFQRGIFEMVLQVRSCDDAFCSGESFVGFDGSPLDVFSEENNSTVSYPLELPLILDENQYFQYLVEFSTEDARYSPSLYNVTVNYSGENPALAGLYQTEGEFISSAFDMGEQAAVQILEWDEILPEGEYDIQIQIRTAPDEDGEPGTWTSWFGEEGVGSTFTNPEGTLIPAELNGKQWVQYRVLFTGEGQDTPILEEIRLNYQ